MNPRSWPVEKSRARQQFPVLRSGLVSRVGALHRVNLVAPFLIGQNCPRKNNYDYDYDLASDDLTVDRLF